MQKNITKMVYAALLTALSIIIPLYFGFLKVVIPPFSATIASHVPLFIAMFISPGVAIAVGIGSTIGFLMTSPIYIAARAAIHILVGGVGAYLIKKNFSFKYVALATAPLHAIGESLIVLPFDFSAYQALVTVGIGTFIHHFVDAAIAFSLVKVLFKNPYLKLGKKELA